MAGVGARHVVEVASSVGLHDWRPGHGRDRKNWAGVLRRAAQALQVSAAEAPDGRADTRDLELVTQITSSAPSIV